MKKKITDLLLVTKTEKVIVVLLYFKRKMKFLAYT